MKSWRIKHLGIWSTTSCHEVQQEFGTKHSDTSRETALITGWQARCSTSKPNQATEGIEPQVCNSCHPINSHNVCTWQKTVGMHASICAVWSGSIVACTRKCVCGRYPLSAAEKLHVERLLHGVHVALRGRSPKNACKQQEPGPASANYPPSSSKRSVSHTRSLESHPQSLGLDTPDEQGKLQRCNRNLVESRRTSGDRAQKADLSIASR